MSIRNPDKVILKFLEYPGRDHFEKLVQSLLDVSYTQSHLAKQLGYTNIGKSGSVKNMISKSTVTLGKLLRIYELYEVNNTNNEIVKEYGEQIPPVSKEDLIREASEIYMTNGNGTTPIVVNVILSYLESREK